MRFFIRFSLLEIKLPSLFFEIFVCLNISPKNGTSPYFEPFYIVKSMQLWYYLRKSQYLIKEGKMEKLTLAVTNIGDFFVNKSITTTKDNKPISLKDNGMDIVIPGYQRPYKWSVKNASQLYDDILDAQKSNREVYRVGTLILYENDEKKQYEIVDGQQRIITFWLLLKSLEINDVFELKINDISITKNNILKNYNMFLRRNQNLPNQDEICDYIKNNCEFIVIITNNASEAFQFFDSQNARGKALYPHDLLKAYHLREMSDVETSTIEKTVKIWEETNQHELSALFTEYLYRLKEWIRGNKSYKLDEKNIDIFKGVSAKDNYPYAQYYKGAYAYAHDVNVSPLPFVSGVKKLSQFQINAPIIAGQPFFEYAKHYFDILSDIQNNDKYEGFLVNDNEIIKTLNLKKNKNGVGNRITRLLLDTALLLYADRFCPEKPEKADIDLLDQFLVYAFIWAYSLRVQYYNVGWKTAQNFVIGFSDIYNSFNIYKLIIESDSPIYLLSVLSEIIIPLPKDEIVFADIDSGIDEKDADGIFKSFLHFFKQYNFIQGGNENEK